MRGNKDARVEVTEVVEQQPQDLQDVNADDERSKLQGALRQYREQDYDELLAAKTREIEALQRRTEEKMARLGQARRSTPTLSLRRSFNGNPTPQRDLGDRELPSASEF